MLSKALMIAGAVTGSLVLGVSHYFVYSWGDSNGFNSAKKLVTEANQKVEKLSEDLGKATKLGAKLVEMNTDFQRLVTLQKEAHAKIAKQASLERARLKESQKTIDNLQKSALGMEKTMEELRFEAASAAADCEQARKELLK